MTTQRKGEEPFLTLGVAEPLTRWSSPGCAVSPRSPVRLCRLPDTTLLTMWPTCFFGLTVGREREHLHRQTTPRLLLPSLDPFSPPISPAAVPAHFSLVSRIASPLLHLTGDKSNHRGGVLDHCGKFA